MALQKLGKYEIVGEIGRGAMGVVYKAFDPILEREVALKTMMASMGTMDAESKARFYREARSAAKLTHRNIVTIYDMGEEQGIPFIAMEYLDGVDLHRKMKKEGPLPLREGLDIMSQVLHGLHYAHQFQIVHRDIKPANIYILKNSTAKILDFGIAKLATSEMTRTGMVLGTVDYMSPEQIRADKGVDGRSDLFSAGVILYELVAGRKPFPGETITQIMFKIVHDPPGDFATEREIPASLKEASHKSLEKEPAKRFQNGDEFARALEEIIQQIDAELTTVRQMVPSGLDSKSSVTAARQLFEGGSFEESAAILSEVLAKEPGHREAGELKTLVDKRIVTEQTVTLEPEPEPARPSGPRGSRIEEILAEIEKERKTSPGAAGRSETEAKDLTLRLEDSGVRESPSPAAPSAEVPVTEAVPSPKTVPPAAAPPPPAKIESKPPAPAPPPSVKAEPRPAAPQPPPPAKAEPRPAPAKVEAKPAVEKAPPKKEPIVARPEKEAKPARPVEKVPPAPPARAARAERSTEELFPPPPSTRAAARAARATEATPAAAPPKKGTPLAIIGGAAALVIVLAVAGWYIFGRGGGGSTTSSTGATASQAQPKPPSQAPATQPAPSAPATPAAAPASGYLAVDAIPWAVVTTVKDASSGRVISLQPEAGQPGPTTPVVLDLPAGRYEIVLRHPDYGEQTVRDLVVVAQQWTTIRPAMPGFKPKIPEAPQ